MSQVSSDDEDYNPSLCVPTSSGAPPNVRPTTASSMDTSSHEVCSSVHMNHAGNPGTSAGTTKSSSSISMPWVRLSGIKGRVRCVCTNPSGTILCAAGDDGVLCMWDFNSTIESRQVKPTRTLTPFVNRIVGLQPIVSLHSAADGSYFVACQDGDRPALIACTGKQLGFCAMGERGPLNVVQCKGHRAPVTSASADLKDAACFFTGSQDGTARLWNKATYERQSVFAVQHGSGQLDDRVAVEAVCGLSGPSLPSFATGGADGCVQLWDARVKYRPGGSVATWDVYAHLAASGLANMDEVFERHVGGLMEIPVGEGHGLVARVGSAMVVMDLRHPFTPSGTFLGKGMGMGSLPCCDDTTPVVGSATAGKWLTCTSRAGFGQGSGGHVVQFGPSGSNGDSYSWDVSGAWPVSGSDEDVCCVCADPLHNGVFFAGMSNGDVAVRLDATAGAPVDQWLATKPEATQTTHRDAQKRPRDAPEWDHDLF